MHTMRLQDEEQALLLPILECVFLPRGNQLGSGIMGITNGRYDMTETQTISNVRGYLGCMNADRGKPTYLCLPPAHD